MKHLHITGITLKGFLLAGLLTACNNDQTIAPVEQASVVKGDQNGKISPLLRLVNDAGTTVQYVKTGKFFGRVSKVSEADPAGIRDEYSYDDNNSQGDLWITKKRYKKSTNQLQSEAKYKIVNGRCVQSEEGNLDCIYTYNQQGYLKEVSISSNNNLLNTYKYYYNSTGIPDVLSLAAITVFDVNSKAIVQQKFMYTTLSDKYPMPHQPSKDEIPFYSFLTNKYLPVFGKQTDLLVHKTYIEWANSQISNYSYKFTYTLDADGLVSSKNIDKTENGVPDGNYNQSFSYSSVSWQGIQ